MRRAKPETRKFWMCWAVGMMRLLEGHPAWPTRRPRPSVLLGREVYKAKTEREATDADYARYLKQRV